MQQRTTDFLFAIPQKPANLRLMNTKILLLGLCMAFVSVSCSSKRIKIKEEERSVTKNGFTLSADWINPKKGKFDVNFTIANDTKDKSFMIPLEEIQCGRGSANGELKHTFFNTGTRNFRIHAQQKKTFRLVCELAPDDAEATGDFRIKIPRVYDFSKGDVQDKSHVILTNVEWKHSDSDTAKKTSDSKPGKKSSDNDSDKDEKSSD